MSTTPRFVWASALIIALALATVVIVYLLRPSARAPAWNGADSGGGAQTPTGVPLAFEKPRQVDKTRARTEAVAAYATALDKILERIGVGRRT